MYDNNNAILIRLNQRPIKKEKLKLDFGDRIYNIMFIMSNMCEELRRKDLDRRAFFINYCSFTLVCCCSCVSLSRLSPQASE